MGRNYRANWLDREVVTRGSPGGPTLINLSMTPRCGHFRGNESRAADRASGFSTSRVVAWGTPGALHAAGHIGRRRHAHVDLDGDRGHQRQTAPPESFGKGSTASAKPMGRRCQRHSSAFRPSWSVRARRHAAPVNGSLRSMATCTTTVTSPAAAPSIAKLGPDPSRRRRCLS